MPSEPIESIETTITVDIDTTGLEEVIDTLKEDPTGSLFTDLISDLESKKNECNAKSDELATRLGERLEIIQKDTILSRGHYTPEPLKRSGEGHMADSVMSQHPGVGVFKTGATSHSLEGYPYPQVIEYGSRYYAGDPYVQDTIDELDEMVDDLIDDVLGDFI